jgi:plasmid maintenance system antidote protein VapI
MRVDVKVAIMKSGRHQYRIAQAIGVSEYRLSRYVHGRAALTPQQEQKLAEILSLPDAAMSLAGDQ